MNNTTQQSDTTNSDKMSLKKQAFISAYKKSFGNISASCESIDIDRATYYRWIDNDHDFVEALHKVEPEETFVDFAERALAKKINSGDTTAIIFALKTKGKRRGYIEKTEQDITSGGEKISFSTKEIKSMNKEQLDDALRDVLSSGE